MISAPDGRVLRDLASRVAEIAALPVQAERRELWKKHNILWSNELKTVAVIPAGSESGTAFHSPLRHEFH